MRNGSSNLRRSLQSLKIATSRYFSHRSTTNVPFKDPYHYTQLLKSCRTLNNIKQIHAQIFAIGYSRNPFLATHLVSKYANLGTVTYARKVFDETPEKDVFLWNAIIHGYATFGPQGDAVGVYARMVVSGICPNRYTFTFVLKACGAIGNFKNGRGLHGCILKYGLQLDLFVGNALLLFYAKCGDVELAREVFDEMPIKDIVTWNSMIAGYSYGDSSHEALVLFHLMLRKDDAINPDRCTLVSILPLCTKLAATREGLWIHNHIVKSGMDVDVALGSGLIMLYAGCGRLRTARVIFERLDEKNIVVWNAMIRGYGIHGLAKEAVEMFLLMLEAGVCPDDVCFTSVLSACSHVGLVEEAQKFFDMMDDYGVQKKDVHYACMVDLFGRARMLDKAIEFVDNMPEEPGKDVLGALMGACRITNNLKLAEKVADKLFTLDPDNAGRYSMLAKMYEDAGRWEDVARIRLMMRENGVRKPLGYSAIALDSKMHVFGVEDESHPLTEQIYNALWCLEKTVEEVNTEFTQERSLSKKTYWNI